jgi:hypothetical protein
VDTPAALQRERLSKLWDPDFADRDKLLVGAERDARVESIYMFGRPRHRCPCVEFNQFEEERAPDPLVGVKAVCLEPMRSATGIQPYWIVPRCSGDGPERDEDSDATR